MKASAPRCILSTQQGTAFPVHSRLPAVSPGQTLLRQYRQRSPGNTRECIGCSKPAFRRVRLSRACGNIVELGPRRRVRILLKPVLLSALSVWLSVRGMLLLLVRKALLLLRVLRERSVWLTNRGILLNGNTLLDRNMLLYWSIILLHRSMLLRRSASRYGCRDPPSCPMLLLQKHGTEAFAGHVTRAQQQTEPH